MNRRKHRESSVEPSSLNADDISTLNTISTFSEISSLEKRVKQVFDSSVDIHSYNFQLACELFQTFVQDNYQNKLRTSVDPNSFYEEVFFKIDEYKNGDHFRYFLLVSLIIDVNLGSQIAKANKVLNCVSVISPNDSHETFNYFERILVWLDNCLKTSFRLKVTPLLKSIFKRDSKNEVGTLRLFIVFLKNFPSFFRDDSDSEKYADILLRSILHPEPNVRNMAIKAYTVSMNLYSISQFKERVENIFHILLDHFHPHNSTSKPFEEFSIDSIMDLVNHCPKVTQLINFTQIPNYKDKQTIFNVIPLIYRCSPGVFVDTYSIENVLDMYHRELLKSKDSSKKKDESGSKDSPKKKEEFGELLRSLSSFLAQLDRKYHEKPTIKKVQKQLVNEIFKLKSDEYQSVALFNLSEPESISSKLLDKIFDLSKPYLAKSIILFCRKWKERSIKIQTMFISMILNDINQNDDPIFIESRFSLLTKSTFYEFHQELLIYLSQFLYHNSYKVRKSTAKFLIHHQNDYPIVSVIILSFLSTEKITNLRKKLIKKLSPTEKTDSQMKPNQEMTTVLFQMLHDREVLICAEALKLLCKIPTAFSLISKFVVELLDQLGHSDQLNRRALSLLLIIKEFYPQIILPYSTHLCDTILKFSSQSHHSLLFLSFLVSMNPTLDVNISLLGQVLRNALCSDSNADRISSALDLLNVSLKYLDMSSEYSYLFPRLIQLSGEVGEADITSKLLLALSKIGALRKSTINSVVSLTKTPNRRAYFTEDLMASSISIPISITLETFDDSTLTTYHQTAFIALLRILQLSIQGILNVPPVTPLFKEEILSRLQQSLSTETSLLILQNVKEFVDCFGAGISPLIPLVIDQLVKQWDQLDITAITSTVCHMTSNILDLFSPYILQFTELFLAKLPFVRVKHAVSIFHTFTTFSEYLDRVDYLVIPAILKWLERTVGLHISKLISYDSHGQSKNVPPLPFINNDEIVNQIKDTLIDFRTIIQSCQYEKYASEILNTMFILLQNKPCNQIEIEINRIISDLTSRLDRQILPYLPQVFSYTSLNLDEDFKVKLEVIRLPPEKKQSRRHFKKEEYRSQHDFSINEEKKRTLQLVIPNEKWNFFEWTCWYDELVQYLLPFLPSIEALQNLFERNSNIQSSLFPISFAIHLNNNVQVKQIFLRVFSSLYNPPSQVIRHFLQVVELCEMSGEFEMLIPFKDDELSYEFENIAKRAMNIGEYAQSLRYYELLFKGITKTDPKYKEYATNLALLNKNLDKILAENEIIAKSNMDRVKILDDKLAEQLEEYSSILKEYEKQKSINKNSGNPQSFDCYSDSVTREAKLRTLRSLEALSRFDELDQIIGNTQQNIFLPFAASAAFRLGKIDKFKSIVSRFDHNMIQTDFENSVDRFNYTELANRTKKKKDYSIILYFKAIAALYNNNYNKALQYIGKLRKELENEIFPLISTDYNRSFDPLCFSTVLTYIEEIAAIKKLETSSNILPLQKQNELTILNTNIEKNWLRRFKELRENPIMMFDALRIISIYKDREELKPFLVQFFLKCSLQSDGSTSNLIKILKDHDEPELQFVNARILYQEKKFNAAYELLHEMIKKETTLRSLRLRVLKTFSTWAINDKTFDLFKRRNITKCLLDISSKDPESYLKWSIANFMIYKDPSSDNGGDDFLKIAFIALFEGLKFNPSRPLPFTIRAISILLQSKTPNIFNIFNKYITEIPAKVWIFLLPQLIARIGPKQEELQKAIVHLLNVIGESYPQAILYSILAPYGNVDDEKVRHEFAEEIMNELMIHNPRLVIQALIFSNGLMRVASTFLEQWHSVITQFLSSVQSSEPLKIDEILSLYETTSIGSYEDTEPHEKTMKLHRIHSGMILSNLSSLSQQPKSLFEISFLSQFGKMLKDVKPYVEALQKPNDPIYLRKVIQKFSAIKKQLNPFIRALSTISLEDAAPELLTMKNIELALPGTDYTQTPLVQIDSLCKKLVVFNSKQKPRKMWIRGTDGKKYSFLLKANEDTRLDERVMQLFDFFSEEFLQSKQNSKIFNRSLRSLLTITTYKVIPLSSKVGLIGWLNDCSSVFDILKKYRDRYNIDIYLEYSKYNSTAKSEKSAQKDPNSEQMQEMPIQTNPLAEKLNFFNEILNIGKKLSNENPYYRNIGDELKKSLLMLSSDSNDWLNRRMIFTTSLASTSISGYFIGLGDRHLKNIMINNKTSKLVHIDFGDSFEVAMERSSFPEKVPFRMTRLFRNALEVTGVDGTLKSCCEFVTGNIRDNAEQILILLETFIHDPLTIDKSHKLKPEMAIERIREKLSGNDFDTKKALSVSLQVGRLFKAAMNKENLCVMFPGWMPWF